MKAKSLVLFMLVVGCVSTPKISAPEAGWYNNMHRLSAAHLYLLPKAADGRKFNDPTLRTAIAAQLKGMAETATAVANDPRAPDADPMIRFTAGTFAMELRQAYASFNQNDPQLSRFALVRISRYCIGCHTRADRGVRDYEVAWSSELGGLSPTQKIEFYLANRRYRSAFVAAKAMATDEGDGPIRRDPRGWLMTIERVMGMVIRVNNDPHQAEELAFAAFSNKAAPIYARREAMAWIRDSREWRDDKKRGEQDSLRTAQLLLEVRPSFVRAMRASGLLHAALETTKGVRYAEAMLYSGLAAAQLRDLNMDTLDQYYYEACVKNAPHSELGERCLAKLEEAIRSANPMLSLDPDLAMALEARLADLRRLAERKEPLTEPGFMWRGHRSEPPEKSP